MSKLGAYFPKDGMDLYETSATWRDVTSKDPTKYQLPQSRRALLCLVLNPSVTGYAYVEPARLETCGKLGKVPLFKDCDLIECVYGLSHCRAWYTVDGCQYPVDRKLALIAIHAAQIFLWVEGTPTDDTLSRFWFPEVTLKKCMLQPDQRKDLAFGGLISL